MKRMICIAIASLAAACAAPMERLADRQVMTVVQGDRSYLVRAEYDPIEFAWFARVWAKGTDFTAEDRDVAAAVVREHLAQRVCEGGQLDLNEGETWHKLSGPYERFNATTGEWRFVGACA